MKWKRLVSLIMSAMLLCMGSGTATAQTMSKENISDSDVSVYTDEESSANQIGYSEFDLPLYLMSSSDESVVSGTCGDDLTWTYYEGVLHISGTGDMAHYVLTPWYIYKDSITTAIIDEGVTSISDGMFGACGNMASVTIPDGVTTIGYGAFAHCTSLTSVTIPGSVTAISQDAFSGCTSLAEVILENGVETIGGSAFENCESLTKITIPDSVTSIAGKAFAGCTGLTDATLGSSLTEIGIYAFDSCINLTSITIPDNVTSIGYCAFTDCTSLAYVSIGSGLTDIARLTFGSCTSLVSVTIGSSVNTIGEYAFSDCTSLGQVLIPESVTSIDDDAFYNCTSLTDIIVEPDNSTYSSQDGVLFNKDVTTLIMCPEGKTGEYTIPESVTTIGLDNYVGSSELFYAFYNCTKLTNVILGSNVTTICQGAFEGCTGLTSMIITENVTWIGLAAFNNCSNLTEFIVVSENPLYSSQDGLIFDKDMTTLLLCPTGKNGEYVVPESVTSIGRARTATAYAFYPFRNCENITSVVLGSNVTTIYDNSFNSCLNLVNITIPVSVSEIGGWAFYDCSSLTDVYYGGSEVEWNNISIADYNDCLTEASIHYNYSISVGDITVLRYNEDEDIYTDDYDSLRVGDTVTFSVDIITGIDIDLSEAEWICSKTEDDENPISFYSTSISDPYTADDEKQVYTLSVTATLDIAGDHTVTFSIPGGAAVDLEISVGSQEAVLVFGATLRRNADLCLTDDTISLYGTLGNGNQDFEIESEINAVTWKNSDPDVAEIVSFQATGSQDLLYAGYFVWKLDVHALKPGETVLTGTSGNGSSDSFTLAVEPEMTVEAPDFIYADSSPDEQLVTCTVTLEKPDTAYLKSFMENLTYDISFDSIHKTELTVRDEWYEISDDGLSAVYKLDVYTSLQAYASGTFLNTATITFTSEHGQVVSVKPWLKYISYLPSVNAWCFSNYQSVQGLTEMSKDSWARIYDMSTWTAQKLYDEKKTVITGGQCYGLALSSAYTFLEDPDVSQWTNADTAYDASLSDLNNISADYNISLLEYIHALFAYQYSYEAEVSLDNNMDQYAELVEAVKYFQRYGRNPVLIAVAGGNSESDATGHALLGYKVEKDETEIRIYVYDCNYPGDDEKYISFTLDSADNVTGWSYSKFSSSQKYNWISFLNDVEEVSDLVLSDNVIQTNNDLVLIGTDSDCYTIITSQGTSYCSYGWFTGSADSGITPLWSLGDTSETETSSMFYTVDLGDVTICNNDEADTTIKTFIADNNSDVTVITDAQSELVLGNDDGQFNVSATPSEAPDTVTIIYTTDDGDTIIELAVETNDTISVSVESGEKEIQVSGCNGGVVSVISDGITSSVDLETEEEKFVISIQENGIVNIETITEPRSDTLMLRRGTKFFFNYTLKSGNADFTISAGEETDQVLVGDWDGDGIDGICLRRGNTCYFINNIKTMDVELTVSYGRENDEVLAGDWNGDGKDSLAMRRNGNVYYFCDDIENPDDNTWRSTYGRANDEVLVGDWGNNGYDSLASRRNGNVYYFSLAMVTDPDGDVWRTTFGRVDDEVLSGDWDGDGTDTLAMRRNGNIYYISNSISNPDSGVDRFTYGRASDEVYAGKWK